MSTSDKLTQRVLSVPTDLKFAELKNFLTRFGYEECTKGKTSGSRLAFVRKRDNSVIMLHKPHPKNLVKPYIIKQIILKLQEQGDLDE